MKEYHFHFNFVKRINMASFEASAVSAASRLWICLRSSGRNQRCICSRTQRFIWGSSSAETEAAGAKDASHDVYEENLDDPAWLRSQGHGSCQCAAEWGRSKKDPQQSQHQHIGLNDNGIFLRWNLKQRKNCSRVFPKNLSPKRIQLWVRPIHKYMSWWLRESITSCTGIKSCWGFTFTGTLSTKALRHRWLKCIGAGRLIHQNTWIPYFCEQLLLWLLKRVLVKWNKPTDSNIRFFLRLVLPVVGFNAATPCTNDGGFWWSHVFQGFHSTYNSDPKLYEASNIDHFRLHLRMCCVYPHCLGLAMASAFMSFRKSKAIWSCRRLWPSSDSCPSLLLTAFLREDKTVR